MPRTKGSKNKNTNTAKNKNIININVNTSTKRKRGRPKKESSTGPSTAPRNQHLTGGGAYNTRAPVFTAPPPPVQYISPPQQDPTNSLLSSFITSRLLNESTIPNRTSIAYEEPTRSYEPSRRETLNFRESIIPKVEDTNVQTNVKPPPPQTGPKIPGPPPPPPPPPKVKNSDVQPSSEFKTGGLTGQDAVNAELQYRASEAGKADMARKRAEKETKKEQKKAEKEGRSMLDSMGISFPSPFTPAAKTPAKTSELALRQEQQSFLDFAIGGTPKKTPQKSEYDKQQEIKTGKLKELAHTKKLTTKDKLQLNDLREEFSGAHNPNKTIAANAIKKAIKDKINKSKAISEMRVIASIKQSETNAAKSIQKAVRGHKVRKEIASESNELEKQIKGVEKQVKKAKKEHTFNVLDDLAYKKRIQKGKSNAMDILTKDISNISDSMTTRGQTEIKAKRLIKLSSAKDKLAKTSFKKVGPGRPRKSNAMSELEKQVSGQLLSA